VPERLRRDKLSAVTLGLVDILKLAGLDPALHTTIGAVCVSDERLEDKAHA
jgi:hypothetical protein